MNVGRIIVVTLICWQAPSLAQSIPNTQQGTPGTLINGPIDPSAGRLTTIEYLGGYIIAIPEVPGSEESDHITTRAWDVTNPNNPVLVAPVNPDPQEGNFGLTGGPFLSHGSIKRDNEVYIGGYPNDAVRINTNGTLSHAPWSGQSAPQLRDRNGNLLNDYAAWWPKGGMMRPWSLIDSWNYGDSDGNTRLTLQDRVLAEWNIAQDSGVTGFGNFMGNLLIYSSDQRLNGVAVYDVSDIYFDNSTQEWKPRLLDTFNIPASQGRVGGYWSEISGHYIVFARRQNTQANPNFFAGIQVVDFSDPTNLRLQCSIPLETELDNDHWTLDTSPMYLGFQDEYAFTDSFKINLETCEVTLSLDITQGQTGNLCYGAGPCPRRVVDTSQYSRIIGNLWFTGGYPVVPQVDGWSIWNHQSAPDTDPPYVAHHIPTANQTNYPVDVPLGFSIPETLRSQTVIVTATAEPGEQQTLTLFEVGGDQVPIDYVISHTGMLTVEPLSDLTPNTTYEVSFTDGIRDAAGNAMEPYSFRFSTGDEVQTGELPVLNDVTVSPQNPVEVNETVTISASAEDADEYLFEIDGPNQPANGGTPQWQPGSSTTMNFDQAGEYFLNVRARNAIGVSGLIRERIVVTASDQSNEPGRHSGALACDEGSLWGVNPDNDTIFNLDIEVLSGANEFAAAGRPSSIVKTSEGEIWVTARDLDQVLVFSEAGDLLEQIQLNYGSQPNHILASPSGAEVYVSLYGSGQLLKFVADRRLNQPFQVLSVGANLGAMAITPDGLTLLVTRFISTEHWGEVYEIDVDSWAHNNTFELYKHLRDDQLDEGRGVPNYLAGIVVNGSGTRAYVTAKKDNVDRGLLNGIGLDLDEDNTVRTMLAVLDLDTGEEVRGARLDFDNADSPSGLAMSVDSRHLFVALQGKNVVSIMGVAEDGSFDGTVNLSLSGLATQSLCVDEHTNHLLAKNYTERTVTAFDLDTGLVSPQKVVVSTVANEAFSVEELSGLQLFYNAFNGLQSGNPVGKMSAEGYLSCASCHIDGGEDGRVWDFTGRGEGLRNNISLKGRSGTRFGNVHWSANFDEIHDFENDIRSFFGGRGLMTDAEFAQAEEVLGTSKAGLSQDLDNLVAYVQRLGKHSLPKSASRSNAGGLVGAARSGQTLFKQQGCQDCHSGAAYTDTLMHDVGTLRSYSGQRAGEFLAGIKTPSLLGLFSTAPYLHDGSAKSISEIFANAGGAVYQAEGADLNNTETVSHVGYSYLRDGAGVRMDGEADESIVFSNVESSESGAAAIRFRYGSALGSTPDLGGQLEVRVNGGATQIIDLIALPLVEGQDVNFTETSSLPIQLEQGASNTVEVRFSGQNLILDDLTVSDPQTLARAEPHRKVLSLPQNQQQQLISYLNSLDQQSAPSDDAINIFENIDDEFCFPLIAANGNAITICL
ncbi:MAG: Ig-like domain-containing protein [Pseudomonadota bacterium]